jgi:hypothetical protein
MGTAALERRARRSVETAKTSPGLHLFTLLTHDKFINARAGGDETVLDPEAGEWPRIRRHLEAWTGAGARPVTAAEGVRAVLADSGWHAEGRLVEETVVADLHGIPTWFGDVSNAQCTELRFRLEILGPSPPTRPARPFPLLVPLPCFLRGAVYEIAASQDGRDLVVENEGGPEAYDLMLDTAVWIRLPTLEPVEVRMLVGVETARSPQLVSCRPEEATEGRSKELRLESRSPFRAGRLLIPWYLGLEAGSYRAEWPTPDDAAVPGRPLPTVRSTDDGLLLTGLAFPGDGLDPLPPLVLRLVPEETSE